MKRDLLPLIVTEVSPSKNPRPDIVMVVPPPLLPVSGDTVGAVALTDTVVTVESALPPGPMFTL